MSITIQFNMTATLSSFPYNAVLWSVDNQPDMIGQYSGFYGQLNNIGVDSIVYPNGNSAVNPLTMVVGGDLSGTLPNPSVSSIQGHAVSAIVPTIGQVLEWNGTSYVPKIIGAGFFGSGADGAVVISGTTILTKDMNATTLVVQTGGLLQPAGFRIFCTVSCTVQASGAISTNAGNAAGATRGIGGGGAPDGLNGGTGNGTAGTVGTSFGSGAGGAGGNGSGGRVGGAAATVAGSAFRDSISVLQNTSGVTKKLIGIGGSSGGAGAGDGSNSGGGSGGGAGPIVIVAPIIISQGSFTARGGVGGTPPSGNCGGGGGGGGGDIYLISNSLTISGFSNISGGSAGAGIGTGTAGTAGTAGTFYQLTT